MERRLKTLANSDDEKLADAVLASAQQIWKAGLGAFSVAEQEGGKVFSKLVKQGNDMQKRTRQLAEIKVSGVTRSVTKMADNVEKQASGSWDKIEQVFEDRVSRTLASLGVPTGRDVRNLSKRVEELSQTVAALSTKKSPLKETVEPLTKATTVAKAAPRTRARKVTVKGVSATKKTVTAKNKMTKPATSSEK